MKNSTVQFGYIRAIELKNIRAFRNLHITLDSPGVQRMLSLIIGRNGTCKTTLLRSIAIGLCQEPDAAALLAGLAGQLVSEDAEEGSILLRLADTSGKELGEIHLTLQSKNGRDIIKNRSASVPNVEFFVCGYGSGRGGIGTSKVGSYRVLDSVATLFDYRRSLVDVELTLRRLEDYMGTSRYSRAQKGIKRVLGLEEDHTIHYGKGGGVSISGPGIGRNIPLEGWADGCRMTFNWFIDLYGWAMQADAVTESGGIRGILLVDEIDQNFHPSLQSALLDELREALPEMQVFATTHSPMTALGAESGNVIALHRKDDRVETVSVPSLEGYTADDVLEEEALFDTDPFPKTVRRKLERHREISLMDPRSRTKKQLFEMKRLAKELDPKKMPPFREDPVVKKLGEIAELLKKGKK